MEKVAFFNTPLIFVRGSDVFDMQESFIRYGILSLATYLQNKGFKVKIFDYFEPVNSELKIEVEQKLTRYSPDIVCIPSFTTEIYNANETAGFVKKILGLGVKVVIGGPHLSSLPDETMEKFTNFDIGVIGEGEITLEEIARGRKLSEIEGIIYRQKGGKIVKNPPRTKLVEINNLPLPKYELFELEKYVQPVYTGVFKPKEKKLILPLETTRGCPFTCKFCFRTIGKQVRLKDPKIVVKEVKRLVDKYNIDQMEVIDGTFGVSKPHALKICELLVKEGLNKKIKWSVMSRANTLDEDIIQALKKAGCFYIGIGVESGSDRILERAGKGITTEQIRKVVSLADEVGIEVHSYFILGLPDDTEKDIEKTAKFAKSLPVVGANFAILVPFPGTEVYSLAKEEKMGYKLATDDYRLYGKQDGEALTNKRLSREKLKKLQEDCYRQFYFSSPRRFFVFLSHLSWSRLTGIFKLLLR